MAGRCPRLILQAGRVRRPLRALPEWRPRGPTVARRVQACPLERCSLGRWRRPVPAPDCPSGLWRPWLAGRCPPLAVAGRCPRLAEQTGRVGGRWRRQALAEWPDERVAARWAPLPASCPVRRRTHFRLARWASLSASRPALRWRVFRAGQWAPASSAGPPPPVGRRWGRRLLLPSWTGCCLIRVSPERCPSRRGWPPPCRTGNRMPRSWPRRRARPSSTRCLRSSRPMGPDRRRRLRPVAR